MEATARDYLHLVEHSRKLLGVPDVKQFREVERRIRLLDEREKTISECSLLVALLGGTKVGKTTLVNALAGKTIGEASAIACFTSRPAVFVHRSRESVARARLSGLLQESDRFEVHEEKALEGIILIDTPDFDGIEGGHRDIFHRVLERADLALCVVTTQKYDARALFEVLGKSMGFRRTVLVVNRIDEGIPFSKAIREDLLRKIAPFNLKAPTDEELPLFAISAFNALEAKLTAGSHQRAGGPEMKASMIGDFPAIERLLRERLDRALIKRINEEQLRTFATETGGYVRQTCRLDVATQVAPTLIQRTEAAISDLEEQLQETVNNLMKSIATELVHRRASAIADSMSGPFGAYLRLSMAIRSLAKGLNFSFPVSGTAEPADVMSGRLMKSFEPFLQKTLQRLKHELTEIADRAGFQSGCFLSRLEESCSHFSASEAITRELRGSLGEPKVSPMEKMVLNIFPIVLILLLIRYFLVCLLEAREPGAGMFIGTGFLFWILCNLQASIWIWRRAGAPESFFRGIRGAFLDEAREHLIVPLASWENDVKQLSAPASLADGATASATLPLDRPLKTSDRPPSTTKA